MNKIKMILFGCIFCILLFLVQYAFTPDWSYPDDVEDHSAKVQEYRSLESGSIQAVVLGTSHVQYGVIPMMIYRDHKISAYNISISGLRMPGAYFHLKEALKYQHPQAVFFDVSALFIEDYYEIQWRRVLDDNRSISRNKIDAALEYAKEYYDETVKNDATSGDMPETEGAKKRDVNKLFNFFLGAVVPFYRYHSRWFDLVSTDFDTQLPYAYYGKGYVFSTYTQNVYASLDTIEEVAEEMHEERTYSETRLIDGELEEEKRESAVYSEYPGEEQMKWFYKIYDLCRENDVELHLFKVPVLSTYRDYRSSWTSLRSRTIKDLASDLGIDFFDILFDTDIELKNSYDYRDNGMHMNYFGAVKATEQLGNYMAEECGLESVENPYYEETLGIYDKLDQMANLQKRTKWKNYINYLKKRLAGKTILLSMRGMQNGRFTQKDMEKLRMIGVDIPCDGLFGGQAYIGIIRNGESVYEAISEMPVSVKRELDETHTVELSSIGSANTTNEVSKASILINDQEYALNGKGLNIVIYDEETQGVVDSISFYKTSEDSEIYSEKNYTKLEGFTRLYEHTLYNLYRETVTG